MPLTREPIFHDRQVNTFSSAITTTSATFSDTGLTLTTKDLGQSGTYLVWVNADIQHSQNNKSIEIRILIDNVEAPGSVRGANSFGADQKMPISTQACKMTDNGNVIKVQWRNVAGTGTATMNTGSLAIDGVPESRVL